MPLPHGAQTQAREQIPSGRLSRAGQHQLVDRGTREGQIKRAMLINGSEDITLAASASGILLGAAT